MTVCGHRIFTTDAHKTLLKDLEFHLKKTMQTSNKKKSGNKRFSVKYQVGTIWFFLFESEITV